MAFGAQCSKCGFTNQPGFQFCTNCGSTLGASPPMPATPPAFGAPPAYGTPPMYGPPTAPIPYAYGPPPWEMERRKQIDRTKTGILLLLIGSLLSWIPFINFVGGLLLLIGAILVILGRKAFGPAHSRNVVASIVVFIVGIVGGFVVGFAFAITVLTISPGSPASVVAETIRSAFNTLLIGTIVVTAISSIGSILFTYALQTQLGRTLLFAGYGASVAITIATFAIVSSALDALITDVIASGNVDPLAVAALQTQATGFALLNVIPSAIFAAANYIAWSRINRGEIPAPPAPVLPLYGQPPGQMPPGGQAPPPVHPQ